MHFNLLTTLALASSALAQSSSNSTAARTAKTTAAATKGVSATGAKSTGTAAGNTKHMVMVSDDQGSLTFTPSVITASKGHMVEFMFYPQNHSVAQASFDSPCMPMDQSTSMNGMTGFYSGFMPMNTTSKATKAVAMKSFTIMVNSTDPMWFYCSQRTHCQAGMVGVINPKNTSGQTLEMFAAAAKMAPKNVSPEKLAGGFEGAMMSGVAKETGASTKTGAKTSAAKTTAAAAAGNGTAAKTTKAGAAMTSTAKKSGQAAASTAAVANSSTIKQTNMAPGSFVVLDFASSFGLIGALAASVVFFA